MADRPQWVPELPDATKAEHLQKYGRVLEWMETIPGTGIKFVWGTIEKFPENHEWRKPRR